MLHDTRVSPQWMQAERVDAISNQLSDDLSSGIDMFRVNRLDLKRGLCAGQTSIRPLMREDQPMPMVSVRALEEIIIQSALRHDYKTDESEGQGGNTRQIQGGFLLRANGCAQARTDGSRKLDRTDFNKGNLT